MLSGAIKQKQSRNPFLISESYLLLPQNGVIKLTFKKSKEMSKKLFLNILMISVFGLSIISCNKEEDEDPFDVLGDAFYIHQVINGEVKTAVAFYAYANNSIASATVTHPGGATSTLNNSLNLSYTWLKEPDTNDFITEYPEDGSYQFEVTSAKGEVLQSADILEIDSIGMPEFTKTEYNDENYSYELEWSEAENADAYLVKVLNDQEQVVFTGFLLNDTADEYKIRQNTGDWDQSPVAGKTYTFQLLAYAFEEGVEDTNYAYHIQEISISEQEVIWGE